MVDTRVSLELQSDRPPRRRRTCSAHGTVQNTFRFFCHEIQLCARGSAGAAVTIILYTELDVQIQPADGVKAMIVRNLQLL